MMTPKPLSAELTTPRGAALRGRRGCRPAFGAWGEDLAAQYWSPWDGQSSRVTGRVMWERLTSSRVTTRPLSLSR